MHNALWEAGKVFLTPAKPPGTGAVAAVTARGLIYLKAA